VKRRGIRPVRQQKDYDCGLACLAMYLDLPYGDVIWTARNHFDRIPPTKRGFVMRHVLELAETLDRPLVPIYRGTDYLAGRTGILGVVGGPKMNWAGHWIVLKDGHTVIDPDDEHSVWSLTDYLRRWKCRTGCVLVAEDG
tara:strand:+ start:358 stop:777 length:420 start_codon:yes stop_codon:yes gene_type:complete